MSPADQAVGAGFDALARTKLVKILGPERGEQIFTRTLRAMEVYELATADQLYAFSERLVARGGIEAAIGAMLGVTAVVRGAVAHPSGPTAVAR